MVKLIAALTAALPLYVWPDPGVWDPWFNVIAASPKTAFDIIVNPNSGPGVGPLATDYIKGVATLNNFPNVRVFGYIATQYAASPLDDMKDEIATYANWAAAYNLTISGIFMDEATQDVNELGYMQSLATYTWQTLPKGKNAVWTNPGTPIDASFYKYANLVTAYEGPAANFDPKTIPLDLRRDTSLIFLDHASNATQIEAERLSAERLCYQSVSMTAGNNYKSFDTVWSTLAGAIQASAPRYTS